MCCGAYYCGTRNGYGNRGCRCDECRAAWAEAYRRIRSERRAKLETGKRPGYHMGPTQKSPDELEHGRKSTYLNWGCRCVACTAAHSQGQGA